MSIKYLVDETRSEFIADSELSPSREIQYVLKSDPNNPLTRNALVGAGTFSQKEKEKVENFQSFGSLNLPQRPVVSDKVIYDGVTYKVVRYHKLGTLYVVYGEISQHNKRSSTSGRPKSRG